MEPINIDKELVEFKEHLDINKRTIFQLNLETEKHTF